MLIAHQRLSTRPWDFVQAQFSPYAEKALHEFIPKQHLQWTSSARAAISQLLHPGEKVGLPAFTCSVVADALVHAQAEIIFIDAGVIPTIADIEKHIKKIDTLLLPYNFGFLPAIEKIVALCKKHQVRLLEDCAQALGATAQGKYAGSFGDAAVYSFGISKNIGVMGGMLATDAPFLYRGEAYPFLQKYAAYAKALSSHLFFHPFAYSLTQKILPYTHDAGEHLSYAMPDFAKFLVLVQTKRYHHMLALRRNNAAFLLRELSGYLDMVKPEEGTNPAWLYFVFFHKNRDALQVRLLKEGIDVRPLQTFCDVSKKSEKALLAEKTHLAFALLRPQWEIEKFAQAVKHVMKNG